MKHTIYTALFFLLVLISLPAGAQVYKTAADTVKLNKELTDVNNDIASLTAKLTIAQNNLPGYRGKAEKADGSAHDAAAHSSVQADKAATGNDIKDAKQARRDSRKAYREAKRARSANENVGEQDNKIASLKGQLARKQERLLQLTAMRDAIYAQLPAVQ
ncbi:hypothetical protein [Flaviaesturariibacter amylovorans]|uniref:Uncharacterized protein n=1 Tax=Flaviaesturariibacter amylovorans TaxID=1084520 RepID=A0ABP8HMR3_9BACT